MQDTEVSPLNIAKGFRTQSAHCALFLGFSMLTLSGCVNAVSDDQDAAASIKSPAVMQQAKAQDPALATQTAKTSSGAGGYVDPAIATASPASGNGAAMPSDAQNPQQVYGQALQLAGLATQSTAISAGTTSIFSNSGQPVAAPSAADGQMPQSVPAYAPVPKVSPALNSVYATPAQPEPQVHQPVPVPMQEQSANVPAPAAAPQPLAAAEPAREGTKQIDDKGITLAAFFAGAAKKRAPKAPAAEAMTEVAALTTGAAPGSQGIALAGRATMSDEFDDEHHDDEDDKPVGLMKLASLSGLSRVAPNGLVLQTDEVNVGCFKPELVRRIKEVEAYYHRPAIVTSGYRPPKGVRMGSKHYTCEAADIQIKGVSKWELANYLRSLPDRGGVGTYCHTESVHMDVGEPRDWNWRCRRTARNG
jgi:uncharacterized protein YcbK (DUF882 family)